jgi:hypothetical protein
MTVTKGSKGCSALLGVFFATQIGTNCPVAGALFRKKKATKLGGLTVTEARLIISTTPSQSAL